MPVPLEAAAVLSLLGDLPVALYVMQDGTLLWCNDEFARLCECPKEQAIGHSFIGFVAPEDRAVVIDSYRRRVAGEPVPDHYEFSALGRETGKRTPIHMSVTLVHAGAVRYSVGVVVDLTVQRSAAAGLASTDALERSSPTPVLRIAAGVLVVPLVGHYHAARVQDLTRTVLAAIAHQRAHALILDVTGLVDADERVADDFARTTAAARLLGARCLLAGVSPALAQRLASASASLRMASAATLEDALAMVLESG
ncbi:PAS domain S-box protein [Nannocystis radixulma]|uniref:PAS domain S-box protein n=1 Tax=Nannocystis radixulma TaxID=2995305 RepID=A0ABT5AYD3_9BACT|nr:PAS domain S-box protein [Nannocystis radixulma]MDC0666857.1 PAS domain S-box protein [Nannocystis radixulma]